MFLKHPTALLTITTTLLSPFVAANCYFGNGTDRNADLAQSDRYSACDPDSSGASMCCSQKYGGDACVALSSSNSAAALCWNQNANTLWRESCTDRSWSSVNCVKLFMNKSDSDIPVTNCSALGLGSGFCYGSLNRGCCSAGLAVFIDPTTGEQVATDPALSTNTSSTPTSTASASPSSTNKSSGLSTGAKAGIGVGVSVAAIALLVVGMVLYARRRGHFDCHEPLPTSSTSTSEYYKPPLRDDRVEAGSRHVSELKGQTDPLVAHELHGYSADRSDPPATGPAELGH